MRRSDEDDRALVEAARAGDQHARDRLVAAYLPLVYTIVGRALDGHADVDDVVQETMLRVPARPRRPARPGGASGPGWSRSPSGRCASATAHRATARDAIGDRADDMADPGADFADLAVTAAGADRAAPRDRRRDPLAGQDHRELLALWWLEAAGELTRDDRGRRRVSREHAAVRVQRMRAQLDDRPGGGPRPGRGAALRRPRRRGRGVGRAAGSVVAQAVRPAHPRLRGVRAGVGVAGGGRAAAGRDGAGAGAGRAARLRLSAPATTTTASDRARPRPARSLAMGKPALAAAGTAVAVATGDRGGTPS